MIRSLLMVKNGFEENDIKTYYIQDQKEGHYPIKGYKCPICEEIQELGTKLKVVGEQLTEATVLLAGYELPKQSSSSLKRSASMPLQYEKSS